MTLPILYWILLLGLFGVLDQDLYYAGMKHTTATFATTMYNFLPVINFLLAFLLSFEKVKFRSLHGQAKVFGTLVSVGGVIIMTFIKEPVIELPWTKHKPTSAANYHQNSIKGSLMILGACSSLASFNILHAKTLKLYPALLSLTAMISAAASIEGFIASVVFEKGINFTVWSIHWDIKLLAYVYGGILCSGLANYISGYILLEKGPVFLTSFNPLTMLIVAGMGSFILAEQLDLGKVVGGFVIVLGLYLVLWGKTKDDHGSSSMENTEELLYETCLCVWLLSYYEPAIEQLGASRALPHLIEVVKGSTKEKVVRVVVLTLRNLLQKGTFGALMIDLGLPQLVQSLKAQAWSDEDLLEALNQLEEGLKDNIKKLSSFDKYKQEVHLGHLDWSPMHKDPVFWRENIMKFEENDFQILRVLVTILDTSTDPRTLAVACFDLSQFIQYHPAGRIIVTDLKAKERVMNHENPEVTKNALLCIQRLFLGAKYASFLQA